MIDNRSVTHSIITFQETDPPEHSQTRMKLFRAFSRTTMAQYEDTIRELCQGILDEALDKGSFDATREIARQLHEKVVAYWHDVDFNWGRNASAHYTEDGVFLGSSVRYDGRAEIQEFYNWRLDRGERTNVSPPARRSCSPPHARS